MRVAWLPLDDLLDRCQDRKVDRGIERVGAHPQIFRRSIAEVVPSEEGHHKSGARGETGCDSYQLQAQNGTTDGSGPASVDNTLGVEMMSIPMLHRLLDQECKSFNFCP